MSASRGLGEDAGGVATLTVPVRDYFAVLAKWWHEATEYVSDPAEQANHPAYALIIQLGEPAISLILEDMAAQGGAGWYTALRKLSGASPVAPGSPKMASSEITQKWLEWGRDHGYYTG